MEEKKIELTPFLLQLFSAHIQKTQDVKNEMNKDFKILFDSKGIEMPQNFEFKLKDGALFYSVPKTES